jgi:hypothetical protein
MPHRTAGGKLSRPVRPTAGTIAATYRDAYLHDEVDDEKVVCAFCNGKLSIKGGGECARAFRTSGAATRSTRSRTHTASSQARCATSRSTSPRATRAS